MVSNGTDHLDFILVPCLMIITRIYENRRRFFQLLLWKEFLGAQSFLLALMFITLSLSSSPKSYSEEKGTSLLKVDDTGYLSFWLYWLPVRSQWFCSIVSLTWLITAIASVQPWIKLPRFCLNSTGARFSLFLIPSNLFVTFKIVPTELRWPCIFCNFRSLDSVFEWIISL